MLADDVAAVRRFTRFYTRQVELLNERFLQSRFSLSEGRILYELGHRDEPTASDLVRDLGVDAGYLSRVIKRFEADGLVIRTESREDRRQNVIALTVAGRTAVTQLDEASREQFTRLLESLSDKERQRLTRAMSTVEQTLTRKSPAGGDVSLRALQIGDIGWITSRQGALYAAEYGWDGTFEALVAEILCDFVRNSVPEKERAWIAERDGLIVGSVFLVRATDELAKLRLLYVEPTARGLGLGARLVSECIAGARERGYKSLTLWTNDCLIAARRIYQAQGFKLVEEEAHHSFGKDLVGQNWLLDLS